MSEGESESQEDFESVLAKWIQAREAGDSPPPHEFIARHQQHAEALREFFASEQIFSPVSVRSPDSTSTNPTNPSPVRHGTLQPGALAGQIIDDFELVTEIARGGMGVVYEAVQKNLRRSVAIKFLTDGVLANDELRFRFRMEAEAAATLSHPNILPIHGLGCWGGLDYFVMPLVDGRTLQHHVSERAEQLAARGDQRESGESVAGVVEFALRTVCEIGRGVAYAHRRGIIHRDLKPDNVMLDQGVPKIVDFGLAKWHRDAPEISRDGQVIGTPSYMSPEQAGRPAGPGSNASADVTASTDVYGLGGILVALLIGEPPHVGSCTADVLNSALANEPPSLRQRWAGGLPRRADLSDIDHVISRSMATNPLDRYRSADEFADDLECILRGDTPTVSSDRWMKRVTRELARDTHQRSFTNWGRSLRWIGAIVMAAHLLMFILAWHRGPTTMGYFIPRISMLAGIAWVIHTARDGLWLPRLSAERPIWSIWIGYLVTLGIVNVIWLLGWLEQSAVMVTACLMSGFAFVAMAGHLWGGSAILGGFFYLAAGWSIAWPMTAPLALGIAWLLAMEVLGRRYAQTKSDAGRTGADPSS
ncbi:MAG: serine/threonine-protein kinase [Planctomycetota bacterium]